MNSTFPFRPATFLSVALLVGATGLTSCEKDPVLKTLDVQLTTAVEVNVPDSAATTGTWLRELDPDANADVRDNRQKIQKIVVGALGFQVKEFVGAPGTTATGTWKLYPAGAPTQVTTVTTVADLDALQTSGAETALPVTDATRAQIVDLINSRQKLVFAFEGSVSQKPVYARFEVHINTKIDVGL